MDSKPTPVQFPFTRRMFERLMPRHPSVEVVNGMQIPYGPTPLGCLLNITPETTAQYFQTIPLAVALSPTSLSLAAQPNCDIRPTCHHALRHSVTSIISSLRPFQPTAIRSPAELMVLSHSTALAGMESVSSASCATVRNWFRWLWCQLS